MYRLILILMIHHNKLVALISYYAHMPPAHFFIQCVYITLHAVLCCFGVWYASLVLD
jgi:hypothetical protein